MFVTNHNIKHSDLIRTVLLLFFSLLSIYLACLPSIHVDEGWFHNIAYSTKTNGYPSFNAFSDVPVFKGYYGQGGGIITKMIGILISLPISDVSAILLLRVLFALFFIFTLWEFLRNIEQNDNLRLLVYSLIIFNPLVISVLSKARSESLMASLAMWMMMLIGSDELSKKGIVSALLISYIMMTLHPNGVVSLLFIGLYVLLNKFELRFKFHIFIALIVMFIYMYFNQVNNIFFPSNSLTSAQYSAMYFAGEEQKLLSSIAELPNFLFREVRRYPFLQLKPWKTPLVWFILITVQTMIAWFAVFAKKLKWNDTFVLWGSCVTLMFIFLGNKTSLYLIYLIPFIVPVAYNYMKSVNNKTKKMYLAAVIFLTTVYGIAFFKHNVADTRDVEEVVKYEQQLEYDAIYAPMEFSPYLADKNMYTTIHKVSNQMLKPDMLTEDIIVVIDTKKSSFEELLINFNPVSHNTFGRYDVKQYEHK